jgi:Sulfotransferase domain
MKRPNFFIIGAPKCGTTALSEYLKAHPQVYFSPLKEPCFFCPDLITAVSSLSEYLDLFRGASDEHVAVGEGTVWYLRSQCAVRNILEFNREAKLIVMLRNPIDMAYALHSTILRWGQEIVRSFEKAWHLQDRRARGEEIPSRCIHPHFLQYGWFCKISEQVQELFAVAPRGQIMIVFFDDFSRDPKVVYEQVLAFLDLKNDGRNSFPVINENSRQRLQTLVEIEFFLRLPSQRMEQIKKRIKCLLGLESFGVARVVHRINQTINMSHAPRPPLSDAMREELREYFANDVTNLSHLLGRDLSCWLQK